MKVLFKGEVFISQSLSMDSKMYFVFTSDMLGLIPPWDEGISQSGNKYEIYEAADREASDRKFLYKWR